MPLPRLAGRLRPEVGSSIRQISQVPRGRPWGQVLVLTSSMVARQSTDGIAADLSLRYGVFRPLLSAVAAGPAFSGVEIDGDQLRVRMGPSFKADIPLSSIEDVKRFKGLAGGIGVHGWRGRWLVNGAVMGIVTIEIDPPVTARVLGFPVRLRTLQVSVKSPDELIAALRR